MKLLAPILFSIFIFCLIMFYSKFKVWFKFRRFKYKIKGNVDEIKIIENKLYFIIKWKTPKKLKEFNPGSNLEENTQYYHHFIKNIDPKETVENINKIITSYVGEHLKREFYLLVRLENNTIRELTALENSGLSLIMYFILSFIFFNLFLYVK